MCYHVSTPDSAKLREQLPQLSLDYEFPRNWHKSGFDRPVLPGTVNNSPDRIIPIRWKLIPMWVKSEEEVKKYANTLNAENSEIFDKNSYKQYIKKYRGVLWVDGFFEPHKVEGVKETENFLIYKPDKSIFPLGVVFTPWFSHEQDEIIHTFAVITVPANPLLTEIHNEKKRMPLILKPDQLKGWMNASTREEIEQFFQPYDGELGSHRVFRVTAAKGIDTNVPNIHDEI